MRTLLRWMAALTLAIAGVLKLLGPEPELAPLYRPSTLGRSFRRSSWGRRGVADAAKRES